eukprot:NODE_4127_length_1224_cov_160.814714_g3631_i0.p1 GENE.NODE_4127_length_1224_cov_160.814714_g3631_i0~~NODE_4127_length_1224_cov_160.814714_g3631_i0.p1  ORF type:complete len:362 (-),score=71.28 NODE_4127_length_1224_cov_160.814714_g3631_i0:139-1170(-)
MAADLEKLLLTLVPRYRWTADQVVEGVSLAGKVVVVIGATSGIGIPTTRALARTGAKVILTARDLAKGEPVAQEIRESTGNQSLELWELDLASLDSVKTFVANYKAKGLGIDVLLNNAGIMACPYEKTVNGFESQLHVNFLAPALLISSLASEVRDGGRIIVVSSIAHKRLPDRLTQLGKTLDEVPALIEGMNLEEKDYDKWLAYSLAKSWIIIFANELNKKLASRRITVNSLHPGGIMTPLQKHLSTEEMQQLGWLDKEGKPIPLMKTPEEGASTSVWASVSPELEGKGGLYLENCSITESTDYGGDHPIASRSRGTAPHVWREEWWPLVWQKAESLLGQKL